MGKVYAIRHNAELDPATFMQVVQTEIEEHGVPLVAAVALVLDAKGNFLIHCSTTDRERRHAIISVAHDFSIEELRNAMVLGFEPLDPEDAA